MIDALNVLIILQKTMTRLVEIIGVWNLKLGEKNPTHSDVLDKQMLSKYPKTHQVDDCYSFISNIPPKCPLLYVLLSKWSHEDQ